MAIVILNWNGRSFLEKFLPSVLASAYSNKRVIVADNGSADDSVAFLQMNFPQVELLQSSSNEGFAKGYNTALKQVSADYFVLLNSDVEVCPAWIEPIITLMESDKTIAACQPKILDEKNKTLFLPAFLLLTGRITSFTIACCCPVHTTAAVKFNAAEI